MVVRSSVDDHNVDLGLVDAATELVPSPGLTLLRRTEDGVRPGDDAVRRRAWLR
jgi:hypothetical protein